MEEQELRISKKYLKKLLDKNARSLVGALCKRIEVLEQQKALTPDLYKSLVKEHIYESYRNVLNQIKSFSYGVKFISPKDK